MPAKKTSAACPLCGKPTHSESAPFCSKRCQEIDLHRWATGRYAIPTNERPDEPNEEEDDGV